MSDFTKYNKLQNVSSAKLINKIVELGLDNQMYEVREKIHGANFSITEFGAEDCAVLFGRRSGYLYDHDGSFYGHLKLVDELREKVAKIRQYLPFSASSEITVFGEIFGGGFYGESTPQTPRVQSGVEYHPDVKFMAFDVMVDGEYLPAMTTYRLLKEVGFDQAPVIALKDTLQEALDMPVEFTSTVPQYYGLECKPENLAEGYVIKPVKGNQQIGSNRLILKYKTAAFSENKGAKVGKTNVVKLSDIDQDILEDISVLVCQNRLDNVISKIGKVEGKDFPKVTGLLVQDVIVDYALETLDEDTGMDDILDDFKQFKKELNRLAAELLRQTWVDLIQEI